MDGVILKEESGGVTLCEVQLRPCEEVIVTRTNTKKQRITSFLKEIFLPQGYPGTVSSDYMQYQIWDTLQELCSSLNGTLASHAIFKGMGVGNSEATALSATYTWLLKDGAGMVSNILFAWSKGTLLDIDAKRWRLFADVLNDLAMLIDLLSPLVPASCFTVTVCCTTVFRSLVGVAGGCTRATIKQHQALRNNTADVSAKDGSQEKMSNLLGLLLSMALINLVSSSHLLTWTMFTLLTVLHLYFNYRACSCLVMKSLNPARYTLLLDHWFSKREVPSPQHINSLEPFILGFAKGKYAIVMGASVVDINLKSREDSLFSSNHVIYIHKGFVNVCFGTGAAHQDMVEAYYYASLIARQERYTTADGIFRQQKGDSEDVALLMRRLSEAGWDLSFAPLGAAELRYSVVK